MTMNRLCSLPVLTLLAVLVAAPMPGAGRAQAGQAQDEAARQLALGRGDLEAGRPDRAIKAATSALRLDPTLVEALLVHGLALEAKKDYSAARALALAYVSTAGDAASSEGAALLARIDHAEPVRTRVQRLHDGEVTVSFSARAHVEDPVLHWRVARGEWREAWMERDARGEWEFALTLPDGAASKLSWWVETGLGEPLMEQDEDGGERPFRLAMN
jgi:tetratricopeptide (TPR) repeat protein